MKKTILAILAACAMISTAHAQTAVVVQRPSLLSDLAETVGALVLYFLLGSAATAAFIVLGEIVLSVLLFLDCRKNLA